MLAERGAPAPKPLGFQTEKMDLNNRQRPCPGGTCDNSPTFQRWVDQCRGHQVPKGRLKRRAIPQPSLRDWTAIALFLPNIETLGYCRASLRDEENKSWWHWIASSARLKFSMFAQNWSSAP